MANTWVFTQISGRGERRSLSLGGYNAPFGRPRKGAIIKEHIKSRIQTTRYPGGTNQTRHAFGTNWEPMELKGRWMSKRQVADGAPNTANEIADNWILFMKDERTCRISWGFILSFTGYIEELELERESEDEIAWRMVIQVDGRDDIAKPFVPPGRLRTSPNTYLQALKTWVDFGKLVPESIRPDTSASFLDTLESISSLINQPSAILNDLAGQFDDLEKGTRAALQNAKSAITGIRTATLLMQQTVQNAQIDEQLLVRSGASDATWAKWQQDMDATIYLVLNDLAQFERALDLSSQAKVNPKSIVAKDGDTWESLSVRATGGIEKASAIRELAGAVYGQLPTIGESYLVL